LEPCAFSSLAHLFAFSIPHSNACFPTTQQALEVAALRESLAFYTPASPVTFATFADFCPQFSFLPYCGVLPSGPLRPFRPRLRVVSRNGYSRLPSQKSSRFSPGAASEESLAVGFFSKTPKWFSKRRFSTGSKSPPPFFSRRFSFSHFISYLGSRALFPRKSCFNQNFFFSCYPSCLMIEYEART